MRSKEDGVETEKHSKTSDNKPRSSKARARPSSPGREAKRPQQAAAGVKGRAQDMARSEAAACAARAAMAERKAEQ